MHSGVVLNARIHCANCVDCVIVAHVRADVVVPFSV